MIVWRPTAEALTARATSSPIARGNPILAGDLVATASRLERDNGADLDALLTLTRAEWEARRDDPTRPASANDDLVAALVAAEAAIRTLEGARLPADNRAPVDQLLTDYSVAVDWTAGDPGDVPVPRWHPRLPDVVLDMSLDEFPVTRASTVLATAGAEVLTIEAPEDGVWGNTLEARVPSSGVLELRRGGVVESFSLVVGDAPEWVPPVGWPPPPEVLYSATMPAMLGAATWSNPAGSLPVVCGWQPFTGGHGRAFGELLARGARAGAAYPDENPLSAGTASAARVLAASIYRLPFVTVEGHPVPALGAEALTRQFSLNRWGYARTRQTANRLARLLVNANDLLDTLPPG